MTQKNSIEQRFTVDGKVQGVFFRKSFVSLLVSRNLKGGATNHRVKKDRVLCTVFGTQEEISKLLGDLRGIGKFNSYGAMIVSVEEKDHGVSFEDHDVNTKGFDNRGFAPGLKIYL